MRQKRQQGRDDGVGAVPGPGRSWPEQSSVIHTHTHTHKREDPWGQREEESIYINQGETLSRINPVKLILGFQSLEVQVQSRVKYISV